MCEIFYTIYKCNPWKGKIDYSFQDSNYSLTKSEESTNTTTQETFNLQYMPESIIDEILVDSSSTNYYDDSTQEAEKNYYIIQNTPNFIEESVTFSLGIYHQTYLVVS